MNIKKVFWKWHQFNGCENRKRLRDCDFEMLRSIVIESYGSIERQCICKNAKMYISYFLCKSCHSECIYNICLSRNFYEIKKKKHTWKEFWFISQINKMEDDELKAIRAQRMAQMQGQAVSLIIVDFNQIKSIFIQTLTIF